jgi:hypothetical protein
MSVRIAASSMASPRGIEEEKAPDSPEVSTPESVKQVRPRCRQVQGSTESRGGATALDPARGLV